MKTNLRAATKLRQACSLWREVNPEIQIRSRTITRQQMTVFAHRALDDDTKVQWFIDWERYKRSKCVMSVRMGLLDERIATLRTVAEGFDASGMGFLDFDIMAAADALAGRPALGDVALPASASAETWRRAFEIYRTGGEDIWRFVGGWNRRGFATLAIWVLHHRHQVHAFRPGFGFICAAFAYGDPDLGHALIEEYLAIWDKHVRDDPSDLAFQIRAKVQAGVERLRAAVRSPTVH